jgi:hypothetical protein
MLEKVQPIEFYEELLKLAKAANTKIPVRVHPTGFGGGEQHWIRGVLIGVKGNNLIMTPLHGKKREVVIGPEHVRLWEGRMSEDLHRLAKRLSTDMANPNRKVSINNPLFQVDMQKTPTKTIPNPPPPVQMAAEMANMATQTDPVPAPVPTAEPVQFKSPVGFAEKLEMYKKLKEEIESKANTEGIERLKKLHGDLLQAREMVTYIQMEIVGVCTELSEFGVVIPDFIVKEMQAPDAAKPVIEPKKAVNHVAKLHPKVEADSDDLDVEPDLGNRSNKDKIIQYLEKNKNYWTSGVELMRYCGQEEQAPADVLNPLIDAGIIERMGVRANIRYRLKK